MQLDPTAAENSSLVHYLRMGQSTNALKNFARFNPNHDFTGAIDSVIQGDYEYRSDVITWSMTIDENGQDVIVPKYLHHVICPIGTYFIDHACYLSPVNQLVITVFPEWRASERRLYWKFQLLNSSFIEQDLMDSL
jgi:hypothetical protein